MSLAHRGVWSCAASAVRLLLESNTDLVLQVYLQVCSLRLRVLCQRALSCKVQAPMLWDFNLNSCQLTR